MNFIDVLLLLVIVAAVVRGYHKGFIAGMIELAGWMGSLLIALVTYPYLAALVEKYIAANSMFILGISFLVSIYLIRLIIAFLINSLIDLIPEGACLRPVDKLTGIIPGLINGIVYASLLSALLLLLPLPGSVIAKTAESTIAKEMAKLLELAEKNIAPDFSRTVQRSLNRMTVETGSGEMIRLNFKVNDAVERRDLEAKMLILVNKERKKEGLQLLKADPELRKVAIRHSEDMFKRGYFSHYSPENASPFDRINAANIRYLTAGENLALAPGLTLAHEGLMKSPGHRANILQPAFGRVGIGILDGGRYGLMITQNFRN